MLTGWKCKKSDLYPVHLYVGETLVYPLTIAVLLVRDGPSFGSKYIPLAGLLSDWLLARDDNSSRFEYIVGGLTRSTPV